MTSTTTAATVKRMVGKGTTYEPARMFLTAYDGQHWTTNRYWLAPTARLAPLLDKFNVSADAHGTYEVNGTVQKSSDDTPGKGLLSTMLDAGRYTEPLARVTVAGGPAYVRAGTGEDLAVFTMPNGDPVTVRADWLEWLSDSAAPYGEKLDNVRYAVPGSRMTPVAILADKMTQAGGHMGGDGKYIPATWEPTGIVLLGVVMPDRSRESS